jgi:hypothetical protein
VNGKLSFQEMYDLWICRLMFFTDFLLYLNGFNAKLQGCDKTIDVMFDNVKAFEIKLPTLCQQFHFYMFLKYAKTWHLKASEKPNIQSF